MSNNKLLSHVFDFICLWIMDLPVIILSPFYLTAVIVCQSTLDFSSQVLAFWFFRVTSDHWPCPSCGGDLVRCGLAPAAPSRSSRGVRSSLWSIAARRAAASSAAPERRCGYPPEASSAPHAPSPAPSLSPATRTQLPLLTLLLSTPPANEIKIEIFFGNSLRIFDIWEIVRASI